MESLESLNQDMQTIALITGFVFCVFFSAIIALLSMYMHLVHKRHVIETNQMFEKTKQHAREMLDLVKNKQRLVDSATLRSYESALTSVINDGHKTPETMRFSQVVVDSVQEFLDQDV